MTVGGQTAVNYTWDNANRLTGISQASAGVSLAYDNANRRTSLTLPNGIVLAYSYDHDSRVTGMTWTLGSSPAGDLEYSYDADGHVTGRIGSFPQSNTPTPVSGNTFNADNAMTGFNGATLTYDGNGNLTSDETNTYTWDARNHLSAISGGATASFVYDAFGRRMSKLVSGATTQFLYDGLNPVQELSGGSSRTVTASLRTGLGTDEYFRRVDSSGAMSFLADALGSTAALTDSGGALNTQYTYEPYGKTTASGHSTASSYQYTGRESDGTGLYFYRARYYSPTLQRFVSQDPIGFNSGSPNVYQYVADDPSDLRDPRGEFVTIIIGGLVGATVGFLESSPNATAGQIAENVLIGAGLGALAGAVGPVGELGIGLATGESLGALLGGLAGDAAEEAFPSALFPAGTAGAAGTFGALILQRAFGGGGQPDCGSK